MRKSIRREFLEYKRRSDELTARREHLQSQRNEFQGCLEEIKKGAPFHRIKGITRKLRIATPDPSDRDPVLKPQLFAILS